MPLQDYEQIWSGYAKRFKATVGDQWGTPERSQAIFRKYVEPSLTLQTVVAELGVGGGKYSIMVAQTARNLYGVDISNEMLDLTAERLKSTTCKFIAVKTDGNSVAIEDNAIDLFFSFDSMVHIFPYDLFRYVDEMRRFLKPGGKAIFEFADWDSTGMIQKFLKDHEVYAKTGKLPIGAFGFISRAAITKMAEYVGLSVTTTPEQLTDRTSVIVLTKK